MIACTTSTILQRDTTELNRVTSSCFQFGKLLLRRLVHSSSRPFTCGTCQASFKRKYTLRRHLDVHSNSYYYDMAKLSKADFEAIEHEIGALMDRHSENDITVAGNMDPEHTEQAVITFTGPLGKQFGEASFLLRSRAFYAHFDYLLTIIDAIVFHWEALHEKHSKMDGEYGDETNVGVHFKSFIRAKVTSDLNRLENYHKGKSIEVAAGLKDYPDGSTFAVMDFFWRDVGASFSHLMCDFNSTLAYKRFLHMTTMVNILLKHWRLLEECGYGITAVSDDEQVDPSTNTLTCASKKNSDAVDTCGDKLSITSTAFD